MSDCNYCIEGKSVVAPLQLKLVPKTVLQSTVQQPPLEIKSSDLKPPKTPIKLSSIHSVKTKLI